MLPSGDVQEFGPRGNVREWALSPDGTQLAWAIRTDLSHSLLIMPVTGGAIRELTRLRAEDDLGAPRIRNLRWASDGQKLLYVEVTPADADPEYELWQVPAEGGAPARLDVPLNLGRFRFHPNGRSIVFWTQEQRNEIGLMEGFPWQDSGR